MVVAGVFSITKKHDKIEQHKAEWKRAIGSLVSKLSGPYLLRVPTPVCFELMCWNKEWRDFILNGSSPVFRFATNYISNEILLIASKYSIESKITFFDNNSHKVKTMDPLIAAYGIQGGHYVLTENQQDFPETHFDVVTCEVLLLDQPKGIERRILYLLKPKNPS